MTFGTMCKVCRVKVKGLHANAGFQALLDNAVISFALQQCARCGKGGFVIWLDGGDDAD